MITIVQCADASYQPLLDITAPVMAAYAARHGYMLKRHQLQSSTIYYDRLEWVAFYCENGVDCFYVDADAVITNPNIALESFRSRMGVATLGFAKDSNGLCSGVYFAKKEAAGILRAVHALGEPHASVHPQFGGIHGHEQNSFKFLAKHYPAVSYQMTLLDGLQDYPRTHTKDSFILHAAQRTMEERIALLSPYCP